MRTTVAVALAVIVALPTFHSVTPAPGTPGDPYWGGPEASAVAVLDSLPTSRPSTTPYDPAWFTQWIDADADGCDTRKEVLIAESRVVPVLTGACDVSGEWISEYDGAPHTEASDLVIDHLVPLAEAWRSGADIWTDGQREAFANDLDYSAALVGVTASVAAEKADKDPSAWLPPLAAERCGYAVHWILVKYRWGLAVDTVERAALADIFASGCGATTYLPLHMDTPKPVSSPVYRFWSPKNQTHFYTMSAEERDSIRSSYPDSVWRYENERFQAFAAPVEGAIPLYRFWSPKLSGHFFTTNEEEKDAVIADYDDFTWTYEGVAFFVYPDDTPAANTSPVARFWSPTNQHHFYTANPVETSVVKGYPRAIWTYEGDNFRVPTTVNPHDMMPPGNPWDSKDCADFVNWTQANTWYTSFFYGYGDVALLDPDRDGVPCEALPGAPR